MTHISFSEIGKTPFQKLLGHNSDLLFQWTKVEQTFYESNILDSNLLEQVRRTLAFENACEYCMNKAGKPDDIINDIKTKKAMSFALDFSISHKSINKLYIEELKKVFSEKEISFLSAFIAFTNSSQQFGKVLNLK